MKLFLNLFLVLLLSPNCWSQENGEAIEVTYIKAYKNFKDSTNIPPKPIEDLKYKLICTKNAARFELVNLIENNDEGDFFKIISKADGKGIYYKNTNEKLKLHQVQSPVDKKVYLIKLPYLEYNWTITGETKIIRGYLCYKAHTEIEFMAPNQFGKRETVKNLIVVWYTIEIKYPFGPTGFDGLPGLVLEKHSGSFYYIASNISFKENIQDENIFRPNNGIEISKVDYSQHFIDAYKKYKD